MKRLALVVCLGGLFFGLQACTDDGGDPAPACPLGATCCETDADCADVSVGVCEVAACNALGQCAAQDSEDPLCCEADGDCDGAVTLEQCEEAVCTDNSCEAAAIPNCEGCTEDADCSDADCGECEVAACGDAGTCGCVEDTTDPCCAPDAGACCGLGDDCCETVDDCPDTGDECLEAVCDIADGAATGTCGTVPVEDPSCEVCVTDDDCVGECVGQGACDTCTCGGDGQCVLNEGVVDNCCEDVDDCTETAASNACEEVVCVDNTCGVGTIDGCCLDDDGCDDLDSPPCDSGICNLATNTCEVVTEPGCCVSDGDCALPDDATCCETAVCDLGTCVVETLEGCCLGTDDTASCDDGNTATTDICETACVSSGCTYLATCCVDATGAPTDCEAEGALPFTPTTYKTEAFDSGVSTSSQLGTGKIVDSNTGDNITWRLRKDAISPGFSAYLGDALCDTYYNGPLQPNCLPVDPLFNDSDAYKVTLEFEDVEIAADTASFLSFWVKGDAEPAIELDFGAGPQIVPLDYLYITVVYFDPAANGGIGGNVSDEVWSSIDPNALGLENTTNGEWLHFAVDMTPYAGTTFDLEFNVKVDGTKNYSELVTSAPWTGWKLDDVLIKDYCSTDECSPGSDTCGDGSACTQDVCTALPNGVDGLCTYPSATIGESCQPCATPDDCGTDPCFDYACNIVPGQGGTCDIALKDTCCAESSMFPSLTPPPIIDIEGFEGDDPLAGWELDDPFPTDNVTWQIDALPVIQYNGAYNLYFGSSTTYTYDTSPPNPAQATVWTPPFEVETDPFRRPTLSFWLWMSTEWDNATSAPNFDFDTLRVWAWLAGATDPVEIWNSMEGFLPDGTAMIDDPLNPGTMKWPEGTFGNTTKGDWLQVGVDLTDWMGETIRLGFEFDSGDPLGVSTANQNGGVRIDDMHVSFHCQQDCLTGASDCSDDDACTSDICLLGSCDYLQEDPLCCEDNGDCDHPNSFVDGTCDEGQCGFVYNYTKSKNNFCPPGGEDPELLSDIVADFEDGSDGFTTINENSPVEWRRVEDDAWSGQWSYNFSDPSTGWFDAPGQDDSVGYLVSPMFEVPPFGVPYLEFYLRLETEWDVSTSPFEAIFGFIDELSIGISVDGMLMDAEVAWDSQGMENTSNGAWTRIRVDLRPFKPDYESIPVDELADYLAPMAQLVFRFGAGDPNNNQFAGPFVDALDLTVSCKPENSFGCFNDSDCTPPDECQFSVCDDGFKCQNFPLDTPECCEPAIDETLSEDMEGEASGWTFTTCEPGAGGEMPVDETSVWQFTGSVAGSEGDDNSFNPYQGDGMLYFGNGVDYGGAADGASCGTARSPVISLDEDVDWILSFWVYMETETCEKCAGSGVLFDFSDLFKVRVYDVDNDLLSAPIFDKCETLTCSQFTNWTKIEYDLSAYATKDVQLQFEFDSFDNIENAGAGVAIDLIEVERGCPDIFQIP